MDYTRISSQKNLNSKFKILIFFEKNEPKLKLKAKQRLYAAAQELAGG